MSEIRPEIYLLKNKKETREKNDARNKI